MSGEKKTTLSNKASCQVFTYSTCQLNFQRHIVNLPGCERRPFGFTACAILDSLEHVAYPHHFLMLAARVNELINVVNRLRCSWSCAVNNLPAWLSQSTCWRRAIQRTQQANYAAVVVVLDLEGREGLVSRQAWLLPSSPLAAEHKATRWGLICIFGPLQYAAVHPCVHLFSKNKKRNVCVNFLVVRWLFGNLGNPAEWNLFVALMDWMTYGTIIILKILTLKLLTF